jgi:sialic acid synthase SpsE
MVEAIRRTESEHSEEAHARLRQDYGADRVAAATGSGVKELAFSERANYFRTNRSLHAAREIRQGSIIGALDVAVLRTEKELRPGIGPEFLPYIVGATAKRSVPDGEGIEWGDIL